MTGSMRKNAGRAVFLTALFFAILLVLPGCGCKHEWTEATCSSPKICEKCGVIEGSALGHKWKAATCTEPKTCSRCGKSEGETLGHTWTEATCTEPKTCSVCGTAEGEALGHDFTQSVVQEATCIKGGILQKSCSRCSYTENEEYALEKLTSEQLYALAAKSVGEVTTFDKNGEGIALGSCVAISEDGRLVTNFHVIDDAYSIKVMLGDNTYTVETILAYSEALDLALMKIPETGCSALPICTEKTAGGQKVYALGSSEGYTLSFSSGVVASPERVFDGVSYIQHEAAISHGNSGGALLNEYGELIGINTLSDISGQNLNFAITMKELDRLDESNPMTVEEFYEEEGPYFDILPGEITVQEREDNGSSLKAQKITTNGTTVEGNVYGGDDMDVYRIVIQPGCELDVILIPEYVEDAEGILMGLFDGNDELLSVGVQTTLESNVVQWLTYENTGKTSANCYLALFYDDEYEFIDTVAEYSLFFYQK